MILAIALAIRTASFAMGLLLATTINFAPAGALDAGPGLDTAVMFLVMEGSFSVFATILNLAGVALFATSVMNANLMGSNNLLTGILVIATAVVGSFLLLLAPFLGDSVFVVFLIGNLVALVQVVWIIVFGAGIDQEERFPGHRLLTIRTAVGKGSQPESQLSEGHDTS